MALARLDHHPRRPRGNARFPSKLTLESAVKIGLQFATRVQKAKNDVDLSGAVLLQSYGQFLPNLSANAAYSYIQGNEYFSQTTPTVVATKNYGPTTQVTTTLNLFNGLSDFSQLKAAIAHENASSLTLFRAKQQIVIDVTQGYLQTVLDSHVVEIAEKNLSASQERQKLLREQTRVGVRNLSDLYRQEAQTSADESFLLNSQNKRRDDEILLLRKLRLELDKPYEIVEPPLDPPSAKETYPQEAELTKVALEKRADLKASQSKLESAEWNIGVARSGYLPRLDLSFGVYQAGRGLSEQVVNGVSVLPYPQDSPWSQLGEHTYFLAGVTLTWNLFDRLLTAQNMSQAHVDRSITHTWISTTTGCRFREDSKGAGRLSQRRSGARYLPGRLAVGPGSV